MHLHKFRFLLVLCTVIVGCTPESTDTPGTPPPPTQTPTADEANPIPDQEHHGQTGSGNALIDSAVRSPAPVKFRRLNEVEIQVDHQSGVAVALVKPQYDLVDINDKIQDWSRAQTQPLFQLYGTSSVRSQFTHEPPPDAALFIKPKVRSGG